MKLTDLFSQEALDEALATKMVKREKHPELDLYVYNYTANTQFAWVWNDVTLNCRGLIADGQGNIVARPFKKFFSYEQDPIAVEDRLLKGMKFRVFDKMDGSLGIAYPSVNGYAIATRGSFVSDQAKKATSILQQKYKEVPFDLTLTYLYEIIYKQNRIVVDYGDMEDLVLLAIVNNTTGKEKSYDYCKQWAETNNIPIVKEWSVEELNAKTI